MAVAATRIKNTATTTAAKVLSSSGSRRGLWVYAVDGDLLVAVLPPGAVATDTDGDDVKIGQGKMLAFTGDTVPNGELWVRSSTGSVKYVVYYSEG